MNHFCCGSGPDARANVIGENLIGGGNNGWGILYQRIQECMANNGGYKPNFISLDWIDHASDAREIRDYIKFGRGRIGTGQKCIDDSQCATLSCNQLLGICQCQECTSDSTGTCLGCDSGQNCVSVGDQTTNICLDKAGGDSSISSPTETNEVGAVGAENSFYCGSEYFETVKGCNEAVVSKGAFLFLLFITAYKNLHTLIAPLKQCPRGNDDCPEGQTCFAGVDCTRSPTLSPSSKPSELPSFVPSTSSPTSSPGPTSQSDAKGTTSYCGTNFFDTLANCLNAVECSGANGNDLCKILGVDYTCFRNINCDGNPSETGSSTPPEPATIIVPTPPPSLRPTKPPFDFNNTFYCGANYTDAEENCYAYNKPCRSGTCTDGSTCYGGIKCPVPPSLPPSDSPTPGPTSLTSSPTQISRTTAPFDFSQFESGSTNGSITLACKMWMISAFGLVGLMSYH